jgi:hypothetical protein
LRVGIVFESLTRGEVWVGLLTLAGFLISSWWLRGAPLGQPLAEPAGPGERGLPPGRGERIAWSASFGLTLVIMGALIAAAAGVPWSLPAFGLGYWLLTRSIGRAREHRHESPAMRRVAKHGATALTASLIAGIAIVANVLAFKYGARPIDFTSSKVHSLASLTANQARGLTRPLEFTIFHGQDPRAGLRLDQLVQLLDLYRAENPAMVKVGRVDRYTDRAEFEELAKGYPDVAMTPNGGVLIRYGEGKSAEHAVLSNYDIFAPVAGLKSSTTEIAFGGEDAIASAIARLTSGDNPRILMTTGHGEQAPESIELSRPGAGLLRSRLESQGFKVETVNLIGDEIPDEAAAVIVAGPRQQFQPEEVAKLRAYLVRGGHAIFLLGGEPVGLDDLLAAYQVRIGKEQILDPAYSVRGRPNLVLVPIPSAPDHPITEPLANQAIFLPDANPLEIVDAKNPKMMTQAILRTSPSSWAESDPSGPPRRDEGKDQPGPITVGVAVSQSAQEPKPGERGTPPEPRLVAISCQLAGENAALANMPANQDLLLNSIAWLRGKPETIGIPPRIQTTLQITENPAILSRILYVPTLLSLATILAAGGVAYRLRRA